MNPTNLPIDTQIVTITPEMAARLLAANHANRKIRPQIVSRYARDMTEGAWVLNGEAVKVAKDGTLLDGQHRLLASVESGQPFQTILITGLDTETHDTMDTGSKRSFGDVLRRHGDVNVSTLAAAVEAGLTWDLQNDLVSAKTLHSNRERLEWLRANPDIRAAVVAASPLRNAPLRLPVSAGGPFVMRARRISYLDTAGFLTSLRSGANLSENDPVNRLRNWLLTVSSSKGTRTRQEFAAVTIKAWNAYLEGREIRALNWKTGGVQREVFPTMKAPDGRTYDEIIADPYYVQAAGLKVDSDPELVRLSLAEFNIEDPFVTAASKAV